MVNEPSVFEPLKFYCISMYDSNDAPGIHLSVKGAEMLADIFQNFFNCDENSEYLSETPTIFIQL